MNSILEQELLEESYSKRVTANLIKDDLELYIKQGIKLIDSYVYGTYYASKQARVDQLKLLDIQELVTAILVETASIRQPELMVSVAAKLAGRLNFNDSVAAVTTTAEMLAVLTNTEVFNISKNTKQDSLYVQSNLVFDANVQYRLDNQEYLPPMICIPKMVENNRDSGYLTTKSSLLLGTGNHHDGDLCLDVINKLNGIALTLDTEFLSKLEELPTFDLDTAEKIQQWQTFKKQSYKFYALLARDVLYLTHKVDKRGRLYAQGYHINTQGTEFKKASINLANEEIVEGVPNY